MLQRTDAAPVRTTTLEALANTTGPRRKRHPGDPAAAGSPAPDGTTSARRAPLPVR